MEPGTLALEAPGAGGQGGLAHALLGAHRQCPLLPLEERNHLSCWHPSGPILQSQSIWETFHFISRSPLHIVTYLGAAIPELWRHRRGHWPWNHPWIRWPGSSIWCRWYGHHWVLDYASNFLPHHIAIVGNLNDWWEKATGEEYVKRSKCIVDQYSEQYNRQTGLNIKGKQTQGENIADNGGIKEAYMGYSEWHSCFLKFEN